MTHSPGPWTRHGWFIRDANGRAILSCAITDSPEVDEANLDLAVTVVELQEALVALLAKLDAIEAHPEFRGVFTLHMIHGGRYDGPNWKDEYAAARAALAKSGAPAEGTSDEDALRDFRAPRTPQPPHAFDVADASQSGLCYYCGGGKLHPIHAEVNTHGH